MKSAHQKNAEGFKIKCDQFRKQAQQIFDVASCKCPLTQDVNAINQKKFQKKRSPS